MKLPINQKRSYMSFSEGENFSAEVGREVQKELEPTEEKDEEKAVIDVEFNPENKENRWGSEADINAKELKLDKLINWLTRGFDSDKSIFEVGCFHKKKYFEHFFKLIESPPVGSDTVRAEQATLTDLTENIQLESKEKSTYLKNLAEKINFLDQYHLISYAGASIKEDLGSKYPDHKKIIKEYLEYILALMDFFLNDQTGGMFQRTKEIQNKLSKFNFQSEFFADLMIDFEKTIPEIEKFSSELKNSGFLKEVEAIKNGKISPKKGFWTKLMNFSNNIESKFYPLWDKLQSLEYSVIFARAILEKGLNKVEIVDGNIMELQGVQHPLLVQSLGKEKVVPFDINITEEKPNVIVTGDNATGKSKMTEAILLNSILIQTFGYGHVDGGRYSPRKRFTKLGASPSMGIEENQYSRGEKEMKVLADSEGVNQEKRLITMDEILTSTDSLGGLSIVLAMLEKSAKSKNITILTIHSRDLEKVEARKLIPSIQCLKAKKSEQGKTTFQWEEGVGRADAIALARKMGISEGIVQRAQEIQKELEVG